MAGVYRVGFDPRPAGKAIAGGIRAYRAKKAAEELAAKKAAEKAAKEAKAAVKKAKAEAAKVEYEKQKIARNVEGPTLVKKLRGDADAVESELGEFFHAQPGGSGSGSKQNHDLNQMYQRARERAYEIGMDPESGRKGDITRFNTQKRRAATQDRFMGRDQMPVGSDRYKKYTYGQDQAFDKREEKRKEDLVKLAKKGGGKGSKKGPNYKTKAEIKAARKRLSGVTDLDDSVASVTSAQNQKEAIARSLAKKKSVQNESEAYAQLSTPTQAEMQGMSYDDYSKDVTVKDNLAKAIVQAEIKRQQKETSAIRSAELFDNPIATTSQTRRNELRSTEEMLGPVGSDLEGVTLDVPSILKNTVRGKTNTELVRTPREASWWDKIKPRTGGDVRVGSEYDDKYIIHGVDQTRIDNMATGLTDEILIETGDVTKQAARQMAVRMFGGTANTTALGAQATRIEANIKRLVDSGEITLVNVTGMGDSMQVHAVSVDKLKEQLQDKIPGYIASNDNRVRNIGGIMVEYNPIIDRYFILQDPSDMLSGAR